MPSTPTPTTQPGPRCLPGRRRALPGPSHATLATRAHATLTTRAHATLTTPAHATLTTRATPR